MRTSNAHGFTLAAATAFPVVVVVVVVVVVLDPLFPWKVNRRQPQLTVQSSSCNLSDSLRNSDQRVPFRRQFSYLDDGEDYNDGLGLDGSGFVVVVKITY